MSSRPTLLCLPYAGGSARVYLPWSRHLSAVAEVHPIELPGRGGRLRELPVDRMAPLLDDLMTAISPYLGQPFVLFGHSLGALLAFELARLMRRRHGRLPARLLLAGHRAPHLPMREARIHYLPDEAFVERLRTLEGTPEAVLHNDEVMRLLLPALRADFSVSERYRYAEDAPLNCPITVFGGIADPDIPLSDLSAWSRHTTRRCRTAVFPGGHFFLHSAEGAVLDEIRQELAATTQTRVRSKV